MFLFMSCVFFLVNKTIIFRKLRKWQFLLELDKFIFVFYKYILYFPTLIDTIYSVFAYTFLIDTILCTIYRLGLTNHSGESGIIFSLLDEKENGVS